MKLSFGVIAVFSMGEVGSTKCQNDNYDIGLNLQNDVKVRDHEMSIDHLGNILNAQNDSLMAVGGPEETTLTMTVRPLDLEIWHNAKTQKN